MGKGDTFYWLQKVWHFLKGNESIIHLTGTREPVVLGYDRVKGEMKLKDAVNIIERGARNFWWSSAFDKKNCYTNYNAYATAAQMIPAVTALIQAPREDLKDPYRGIALISPKTKRPYNTASGLAVYSTVEEAIQTLKFWKEEGRRARGHLRGRSHRQGRLLSQDQTPQCRQGKRKCDYQQLPRRYNWLSNFFIVDVRLDGKLYPSVEHAYKAAKTIDPEERRGFANQISLHAQSLGKKVTLRNDWEVKLQVMEDLLRQKFRDPWLRTRLLETGEAELIEGNDWGDTYWGVCKGQGKNHLGRLLMKIREELKHADSGTRTSEAGWVDHEDALYRARHNRPTRMRRTTSHCSGGPISGTPCPSNGDIWHHAAFECPLCHAWTEISTNADHYNIPFDKLLQARGRKEGLDLKVLRPGRKQTDPWADQLTCTGNGNNHKGMWRTSSRRATGPLRYSKGPH